MSKKIRYLATAILLLASVAICDAEAHASSYVVTVEQIGSDVVVTGSGAIDLTGLTFIGFVNGNGFMDNHFEPKEGDFQLGSALSQDLMDAYTGAISGPSVFGIGDASFPDTGVGDAFKYFASVIWVPDGYLNASLLGSDTYDNTTLANLGATPGAYVWSWGDGADQRITLDIVAPTATPLPATLPLLAGGLGMVAFLSRRKKRRVAGENSVA
jgi:hypothetical protein